MDKKNKNIVLLIISIIPLKIITHFLFSIGEVKRVCVQGCLRLREFSSSGPVAKKYEYVNDFSINDSINLVFKDDLWLFGLVIFSLGFIGWYFGIFDDFLYANKNIKKDSSNSKVSLNQNIENISSTDKTNWEHFVINLFKEILSFLGFMVIVNASTHLEAPSGFKGLMGFTLGFFIPYVILKVIYFGYTITKGKPKWPQSLWWLIIPFSVYLFMTIGLSATN